MKRFFNIVGFPPSSNMERLAGLFPTFVSGYEKLVEPLRQLGSFWSCIGQNDLLSCFKQHDALVGAVWFCIAVIVYSFVASVITSNCSKVDQLWSITPWAFGWLFWYHHNLTTNGAAHPRLLLVCCLMTAWGLRLTFNFWRRGGYSYPPEEDYRWPVLRKIIGNWVLFLLFNISFIASYQNILLLLIALPAYGVMKDESTAITTPDVVVSVSMLALLVIETVADQQHYDFQEYKHSLSESMKKKHPNPDIRDGFLRGGLFRFSRHPNYFAEQSIWVCVYLFTVVNSASTPESYINVYSTGAILLVLLFQGSVSFSEGLTAKKYPAYATYQRTTSQMIPFFPLQLPAQGNGSRKSTR